LLEKWEILLELFKSKIALAQLIGNFKIKVMIINLVKKISCLSKYLKNKVLKKNNLIIKINKIFLTFKLISLLKIWMNKKEKDS
jgi:hypothetical protein